MAPIKVIIHVPVVRLGSSGRLALLVARNLPCFYFFSYVAVSVRLTVRARSPGLKQNFARLHWPFAFMDETMQPMTRTTMPE